MIELVIGLTLAIILWKMRKLFYANLQDFEDSLKIAKTERELEQQAEIKEMIDLVNQHKKEHGKWFTIKDLDTVKSNSKLN